MTLDFAKTLIEHEDIGDDEITDYLAVSFSSTDYVGHIFGASSLESEDNILRLDRTLADLFEFVDSEIGLDNTLIVLSADHGGPETPGYLSELGFEADYIDTAAFDKAGAIEQLKKRFGIGEELISTYFHPYLYLNRQAIADQGLDQAEVELAVAEQLTGFDGVFLAVSSTALSTGSVADTPLMQSILNNYNPSRSGDIYLVFDPNRFITDFDGLNVAATHGSPWRYDSYVPIIFAGMDIAARKVNRQVHTTAIAPTLSLLIGAKPPTGSMDESLVEVLSRD
jgi:arylsulfatase A-like enzyme